ncbi:divisome protein SepX/GlpR [Streptomyces silvisoli]|uniref:Uncharacterized protein n=1 Tax=Streptomyces silvisoli TaxID=3034235 RepID=A0ABT5ZVS1_9ACTN|nr:hypothetical protein [Streptomyces silvisoli]MDF3293831.1 hypothetical protein [Streptomyces silvisoli]
MSSSGLIYAAIVGAWAAYLVPMWLRRQDELNEARPTERFSTAIRLLSGRAGMERRYAKAREGGEPRPELPAAEPDPEPEVDVRSLALPATEVQPVEPTVERGGQPQRTAQRARLARAKVLARRRRTTTVLFLAFTAGTIGAAVGGLAYLWAPGVPGVLLTFYIAHLRRAERRRFEFTMDQRRAIEAARRLRDRPRERPRPEQAGAAVQEPAAPAAPEPPSPRTADRRALVEQTDHAEWVDQQRNQVAADDGWEPVPVPLPTYVTAPVAPRSTGSVDLGAPDTWSSARSGTTAAEPEQPRPRRPRERDRDRTPLFDQYAPGIAEDRPRAANE